MVIGILQFSIDIQAMVYPATLRKPHEHEAQDLAVTPNDWLGIVMPNEPIR